jgi:hypothetical protein
MVVFFEYIVGNRLELASVMRSVADLTRSRRHCDRLAETHNLPLTLYPEEETRSEYVPLPKQTHWASHVPRRQVTTRDQADSPKRARSVGAKVWGR